MIEIRYGDQTFAMNTAGRQDHISSIIRRTHEFYEVDLLSRCREIYVSGTTIVDVGANIGNHTVFFAGVIGAQTYAFEPNEVAYRVLTRNVSVNGLSDRVRARQIGIGTGSARARLVVRNRHNIGMAYLATDPCGSVIVEALDTLAIAAPVGLIKIDVEGDELNVIEGALAIIRSDRPILVVEIGDQNGINLVEKNLGGLDYVREGPYCWTPTFIFRPNPPR